MPIEHLITVRRKDPNVANVFLYVHTVNVTGGDQGDLDKNNAFKMNSGERVQWTTDLGNFAIIFKDPKNSPFNGGVVAFASEKGGRTSARIAKRLKTAATAGASVKQSFEYSFAVNDVSVLADGVTASIEDPLLEIEDTGGGTGTPAEPRNGG
ncbi:MAG: hypothetical protein NTV52_21765 [Acidobacteria bacterium]|nr:hypothetical protein [Acidobacteriota bacterium]